MLTLLLLLLSCSGGDPCRYGDAASDRGLFAWAWKPRPGGAQRDIPPPEPCDVLYGESFAACNACGMAWECVGQRGEPSEWFETGVECDCIDASTGNMDTVRGACEKPY